MRPGIKATHLWHYTSQKHFKALLNPRLALKRANLRSLREQVKTTALIGTLVVTLLYSYGVFCPGEMISQYMKENSCDPMAQHLPPPPKQEPMEPCPKKKK